MYYMYISLECFQNMLYCVNDVQARFLEGTQPFR